jgi:predicted ester cyclase
MATGLLACAAPDAQRDAATAGAQQRMLDEWTKYVAAWNNHDPAGVAGAFSPDGYIDSPVTGGPARGDAIAQYAGGTFAGFPDFKLEIVNRQPMGDHGYADEWVMKGSWSGTFPGGPLKGVPPSGKPFVVHGSSILEYQNGKLISENVYFDRLSLLGQIGALPPGMK